MVKLASSSNLLSLHVALVMVRLTCHFKKSGLLFSGKLPVEVDNNIKAIGKLPFCR
jgi:hypothetical protein